MNGVKMPTIAIVGAGKGLGRSIAREFGKRDFSVALISRSQGNLDALAEELASEGIEAAGFAADVFDRASLTTALNEAKSRFGTIDVLEYSPAAHDMPAGLELSGPDGMTPEQVQGPMDLQFYGALAATNAVLDDMLTAGSGTLFYTTGASSVHPSPMMGNFGAAAAALRNWALNLHQVVGPKGVYVAHVPIAVYIGQGGPESEPDAIAQSYWQLYQEREIAERIYG